MSIHLGLQDWVFIGTTIIAGLKWYFQRNKLPKSIQAILDKIGKDEIAKIVGDVAKFTQLNDVEKHTMAVQQLQELAKRKLGLDVPTSIANIIVDYVWRIVNKKKV